MSGFGSAGYSSGSGDFDRLSSSIQSNLQRINQNVQRCQRLVDKIGTPQDTPGSNITGQLQQLQHDNNELAKTTNIQMKKLADAMRTSTPAQKKQRELVKTRLTDEFGSVLNKVQKVQREAADKERESVRRARAHSATSSNPFADDDYGATRSGTLVSYEDDNFGSKKAASMQAVIDEEDNLQAIQEREAAIKSLERDILDVNQIFKDLGQLVYEQGEMIDSIESNVESAAVHVEQANTQLTQAQSYQSAARRKKLICLLILIAAVVVIVLVIVIPIVIKNKNNNN